MLPNFLRSIPLPTSPPLISHATMCVFHFRGLAFWKKNLLRTKTGRHSQTGSKLKHQSVAAVASATNNVMNRSIYALGRPTSLTNQSLHIARRRPPSMLKGEEEKGGCTLTPSSPPANSLAERADLTDCGVKWHKHTHSLLVEPRQLQPVLCFGMRGKGQGEGVKGDVLW